MTLTELFGQRVLRVCQERGWSERELARKAGIPSSSVLTRMRQGREAFLSTAVAIAGALDVSLDRLTAPPSCATCDGFPPAGFTCNECDRPAPTVTNLTP